MTLPQAHEICHRSNRQLPLMDSYEELRNYTMIKKTENSCYWLGVPRSLDKTDKNNGPCYGLVLVKQINLPVPVDCKSQCKVICIRDDSFNYKCFFLLLSLAIFSHYVEHKTRKSATRYNIEGESIIPSTRTVDTCRVDTCTVGAGTVYKVPEGNIFFTYEPETHV